MSSTTAAAPAAATGAAPAAPGPGAMSHKQIVTILIGLMMGLFLAALDQTIVTTAIRTIGDDLDGLSLQAWVTTAYLITSTITTPLYGKLSDLFGRKPFFILAISLFILGSVACSTATSMYMLASFRALQGLGAGGLFSLALAIIGDIVSPRERARYQGYFLAVFGTSSVVGPLIGGAFAGQSSILFIDGWRWVFLVNVPLGLIALTVVWFTLNIPHTKRPHRIDWTGSLALIICLVPLLIIAEQGRLWGWESQRALTCYGIGIVGLILFLIAEHRMGDDALIPLRFFRDRTFSLTSGVGALTGMAMFGGIQVIPLYLQIVKGASPTKSGLLMIPLTAGIMVASVFSGQLISRTGRYKIFPLVGALVMAAGMGSMWIIGADTPFWEVAVMMTVIGLGLGNLMQPITLAVQNAMPPKDIGVATSSSTFFRQMGATLGVAVFLSVLFSTLPGKIRDAYQGVSGDKTFTATLNDPAVRNDPHNSVLLGILRGGGHVGGGALNNTSFLNGTNKVLSHPFFEGFSNSMNLVVALGAAVMVLAFLLMFALKEIPLRTQSGIAAQSEAAGAGSADGAGAAGPTPEVTVRPAADPAAATVPPTAPATVPDPAPHPLDTEESTVTIPDPSDPDQPLTVRVTVNLAEDDDIAAVAAETSPNATDESHGRHEIRDDGVAESDTVARIVHDRAVLNDGTAPTAYPPTHPGVDRLLRVLVSDPGRAIEAMTTAERARSDALRLQGELDSLWREYDSAVQLLRELGLSEPQLARIVGEPLGHSRHPAAEPADPADPAAHAGQPEAQQGQPTRPGPHAEVRHEPEAAPHEAAYREAVQRENGNGGAPNGGAAPHRMPPVPSPGRRYPQG